uniref:Fungal lipase-type domain-containing protein n=1 Tax=Kalanchoe fedtschenkoi TaxID=63787 RepID=A0A7N0U5G7_KALFE
MASLHHRVESWIRDQRTRFLRVSWGPLQWRIRWPWIGNDVKESRKKIHEEYERRRKQLQDLCLAVKAESVADLQDILCCMVLSECVYKRPAAEVVRFVNKFKADFGGHIVGLERVQPSSDHVPHRYLLAEAGDTLFASFIGTKQYKDLMTDANILQGDLFHEDTEEESISGNENGEDDHKVNAENVSRTPGNNSRQMKNKPKPAAHRGFLARAKGIPALELYKLAQKKKRKLVLCGHSLGGAVAALATLAILRVMAASSSSKENDNVLVKCITFSQPPVGNAALRDYVNNKGWQHHFKSYCIPEDLVPRLLSPAYFHHYNEQLLSMSVENSSTMVMSTNISPEKSVAEKSKENEGEQLVLGLGPVQTSFWRLAKLVPLDSVRRQLNRYKGNQVNPVEPMNAATPSETSLTDDVAAVPQSLEIEEGSDSISLKPFVDTDDEQSNVVSDGKLVGKNGAANNGEGRSWRRVPYLPSYVPFGELYLLGNSSVDSLSGSEYSKLTSVRTVIAELKELFQSHSMKSYRLRFQRIYDLCMGDNASCFLGLEQIQRFPHLQELLGLSVAGSVELGHIVEPPAIRTATSIVPLGWRGIPGDKNAKPLKVDITGFGLHSCTLVQAQVNGNWCSTTVESFPSETTNSDQGLYPDLQKIRVVVGAPLKRPPKHQIMSESVMPLFASVDSEAVGPSLGRDISCSEDGRSIRPDGLNDFVVYCTSDFATVSKKVHLRTRRVKLLGLEGSGKTSLLKAILSREKLTAAIGIEATHAETNVQEGIIDGLCFLDSSGINLQELGLEASRFKDELWTGLCDLSRKIDLIVLVHNLAHSIPRYNKSGDPEQQPALSLLLDEAKALGTPWILAVTNKFAVSAHQQRTAIDAVLQAYRASPSTTEIINSCPYIMPSPYNTTAPLPPMDGTSNDSAGAQNLILAPINFVRRPFQRKAGVLPVQGVNKLCKHIHHVLETQEEACLQELVRDRLMVELVRDRAAAANAGSDSRGKGITLTAAAVGGSLGAGIGIVFAVIMGAASALRKP